MSQMPDKIWLHKDTKYNTGDIVCGYQYEFAQEIECEGIENFVEYVNKEPFIDKACEWLSNYDTYRMCRMCLQGGKNEFIKQFRKAMEE